MGSRGVKAAGRRGQPFILSLPRQNPRRDLQSYVVSQRLLQQMQGRPPFTWDNEHPFSPDRKHRVSGARKTMRPVHAGVFVEAASVGAAS